MNEPGLTTVCRVCGTAFATKGDGFGEVCLGCLLGAALTGGDASEGTPPLDALPPRPGDLEVHGARFAHYEISARPDGAFVELGRGAMGVTYRAVDTTLHHAVALKVVAPEVAGNPDARARFLREAQAAASLRHPHIASVFFFGERPADRQLFYAMELVEGETLQARVARSGGLPADTVVEIGTQVADALAAAEARGLTHRDLKPANVMLSQGEKVEAKIIDFGLAKTILGEPDGATRQTAAGEFVGTPAFASPEHFNVWQDTDSRSDFYALGATLWYALTGHVPCPGRTPAEVRDRQLHAALPLEQLHAARVPRPVVDLLRSLLSPDPTGRPQTAAELTAAFAACRRFIVNTPSRRRRRAGMLAVAAAGLVLAVAAGGLIYQHVRPKPDPGQAREKSIAVLPFQNLSDDKENAYFTDGVQEAILTDLAKVADLRVISRTSVMQYKDTGQRNLREIGQQLGVSHLLEGSVQRVGNKVRVTAQLIDARSDAHLWAENYDRNLQDVFTIQTEIAEAIAGQLRAQLSPQEKSALDAPPTADLEAYDLYLRALDLHADLTDTLHAENVLPAAARLLDEALGRDPKFLRAWCLLEDVHSLLYWQGHDHTPARLEQALAAVQRAQALAPDAGETHLAAADYYYHGFRDYPHALAELDLARRTLPNDAQVSEYSSYIARRQGRWDESARDLERALELDPRNYLTLFQQTLTYQKMHRYNDEMRIVERALAVRPGDPHARMQRAYIALDARADIRPFQATLAALVKEDPANGADVDDSHAALCEHAPAADARMLAHYPAEGIPDYGTLLPHAYWEGVVARVEGDAPRAQAAFAAARAVVEKAVAAQPDRAGALSLLGLIDAGLGRKEQALAEGRRACALLPVSRDAIDGSHFAENLALIEAWTGEKAAAVAQLAVVESTPNELSYGLLKLCPIWDDLRGDAGFEALVASLAPKPGS